ncbi:MAG: 16S rRNA (guanine(527)-N(7))-methyltransferase RsmG [Ruminococcus sp.]|jgi:16S rRNA (guanine527-N7)-methyltransferase|nr:16S rRNA (guanine(527)-N(7))-methyltransferase RsmG [Ruminococcus sp.]
MQKHIEKKLNIYREFLKEYNANVNLTAIIDDEGIWVKHFIDSAMVLRQVKIRKNTRLADIGSGAGFPGAVLKIYRPDLDITLVEATLKKVKFLRDLAEKLNLDLTIIHGRSEEQKALFGTYDYVTARAVADIYKLKKFAFPLLNTNGKFIALKGITEEIKGADSVKEYCLPNGDKRKIYVFNNPITRDK